MMLRWMYSRGIVRLSEHRFCSATATSPTNDKLYEDLKNVEKKKPEDAKEKLPKNQSDLVAAAFASLQTIGMKSNRSYMEEKLSSANDLESLLSIADQSIISKYHASRILDKLADWVKEDKYKLQDFNMDSRYIKVHRIVTKIRPESTDNNIDLGIVLSVAADKQTTAVIKSLDLPRLLQVLSMLASKKRRSLPILRSLSDTIVSSSEKLNIKQAADVLYACATLSFADDVLLEKAIADSLECLKSNENPSVVRSIVNSLGMLRYRHTVVLESICSWFIENSTKCLSKDSLSILYTLATVNYLPSNFENFMKKANEFLTVDKVNKDDWVTTVWSLIVLNHYDDKLLDSVLSPDFLQQFNFQFKIQDVPLSLKLLNINGCAKLQKDKYKYHLLEETSPIFKTHLARSKEDQSFHNSLVETISNIITLQNFVRTDVNSKMGFLIDAEIFMDDENQFMKLSTIPPQNVSKVAIMGCSYQNMCRGCANEPTGITALIHRLIRDSGYKLLVIPYTEFNPNDKLMPRVQYLSEKLKQLE